MWYKNVGTTLFHFVTNHAFDRQTDGQTDSFLVARPRCVQCMQRSKNGETALVSTIQRASAPCVHDRCVSQRDLVMKRWTWIKGSKVIHIGSHLVRRDDGQHYQTHASQLNPFTSLSILKDWQSYCRDKTVQFFRLTVCYYRRETYEGINGLV